MAAAVALLAWIGATSAPGQDAAPAGQFAKACADAAGEAEGIAVQGAAPDWLFLRTELAHLGAGDPAAAETAASAEEAIVKYHQALQKLGVRLLLVPVPPKAAIYPEKFSAEAAVDGALPAMDAVFRLAPFYDKLRAAGVEVLDLEPVFLEARKADDSVKYYCAQDSHWTPLACEMAAKRIVEQLGEQAWVTEAAALGGGLVAAGETETLKFKGDLRVDGFEGMADEEVAIRRAGQPTGDGIEPVDGKFPESPVILVGDSHTRVFQAGGADMHCKAAGLRDHLQALLGFGIDHHANNGSGADVARVSLLRATAKSPGYWDNKKLLVWCFSAREFTQGKWREVPARMER